MDNLLERKIVPGINPVSQAACLVASVRVQNTELNRIYRRPINMGVPWEVKMKVYVGNLSREVTAEDIRHAFEGFGQVADAIIIRDKTSRKPRGFGFVEMPNEIEAHAAISGLNGKELKGQPIIVNEARPRPEGRRGGGPGKRRQT